MEGWTEAEGLQDATARRPAALAAALARARLEVDLDALAANVAAVRRLLRPGTLLLAVVKGDGYGHGAVPVAQELVRAGADWLGTATLEAAIRLREAGLQAPLLVFDPPVDEATARLWPRYDLRAVAGDREALARLSRAARREGRPVAVHLELDLGFGRWGFAPGEADAVLAEIRHLPGLRVEGLCCHLPAATRPRQARRWYRQFRAVVDRLERSGSRPPLVHCAESALLLSEPSAQLDLVRVGNLLYGHVPRVARGRADVHPVARLRVRVLAVTGAPAGRRPGYRGSWSRRAVVLATLGVGLADGVGLVAADRLGWAACVRGRLRPWLARLGLVPPWPALVAGGRRVPLRGEFLMNHCLVDATGLDVRPGQEVELEVPRLTASAHLPVVYLRAGRVVDVCWRGQAAADPGPVTVDAARGEG